MTTRLIVMGILLATLGLGGCAWSIGKTEAEESRTQPTMAQELRELKEAQDEGLISDEEYEAAKRRLLESD